MSLILCFVGGAIVGMAETGIGKALGIVVICVGFALTGK